MLKVFTILFILVIPFRAVVTAQPVIFSAFTCESYMDDSPLTRSTAYGEEQVVNGVYQGVAQQYNALTGQLHSVKFWGRVNPLSGSSSNTLKVVVYNANQGLPGTIIGSQNVVVNSSPFSYEINATFSSPLNIPASIIISVEPFSPSTDNFFIQRNAPPDGQFLNLIKLKQASQWFKNLAAGDPSFDFDFMILPVTSTNLSASFTSNTTSNTTQFTNTSSNATSYDWNFGDGNSSTAISPSHNYAQSGVYNVKLRAFRSGITMCIDSVITPVNVVLTSIPNISNEIQELVIHGNLISENLIVQAMDDMFVKIIDSSGREVKSDMLEKNKILQIDIRHLTPGIYYIQTPNNNKVKFIKLNP